MQPLSGYQVIQGITPVCPRGETGWWIGRGQWRKWCSAGGEGDIHTTHTGRNLIPTPTITVDTVVTDVESVLAWLRENRQVSSPILVWGHSLGSAVASRLLSLLRHEGSQPAGLVLESPFNNMTDMVRNHKKWSKIPYFVWRKMPWFDWFFTECLADNDVGFVTDQRLAVIDCPVLILHAEDDAVVPYKLGLALYESAQQVTILHHNTNSIWENTIKTSLPPKK